MSAAAAYLVPGTGMILLLTTTSATNEQAQTIKPAQPDGSLLALYALLTTRTDKFKISGQQANNLPSAVSAFRLSP